jgi:phosphoglycolate phosphatase-like HAD superfamily hydrolase
MGAGGELQREVIHDRPELDHVILDWNGTLIADTRACWDADNLVITAFGGSKVSLSTRRDTLDLPIIEFYRRHGCDISRLEAEGHHAARIFHDDYHRRALLTRTRRGARQLLDWLGRQGVRRVILSNFTKQGISAQLDRLNIRDQIDLVLANDASGAVLTPKSKEQKLRAYLADVQARHRVAIVGDAPEEILMGKKAGIWTISLTGGSYSARRLRAARPHFLVHSLHQATDALRQIGANGSRL